MGESQKRKFKPRRKVRCLKTGKFYQTWERMRASKEHSVFQKNSVQNKATLAKMHYGNTSEEECLKRAKSIAKAYQNPELRQKKRDFIIANREYYRKIIEFNAGMRSNWSSEPENMKITIDKLRTYRNGRRVLRFIECEREKSTGVVHV